MHTCHKRRNSRAQLFLLILKNNYFFLINRHVYVKNPFKKVCLTQNASEKVSIEDVITKSLFISKQKST